jgi:hypothetical protein
MSLTTLTPGATISSLDVSDSTLHTELNTSLLLDIDGKKGVDQGTGTLVVSSTNLYWLPTDETQAGLSFAWQYILMHAVANEATPPCIYCQLNEEDVRELRIVPADQESLGNIYKAMCEAAELNPDEDIKEEVST